MIYVFPCITKSYMINYNQRKEINELSRFGYRRMPKM